MWRRDLAGGFRAFELGGIRILMERFLELRWVVLDGAWQLVLRWARFKVRRGLGLTVGGDYSGARARALGGRN